MRLLKIVDFNDRNFDSCLPSFDDITTFPAVVSPFSYNGNRVPAFITTPEDVFEESLPDSGIVQFPFASNPLRNVQLPAGIVTGSVSVTFKGGYLFEYPQGVTGQGSGFDSMLNIFKTRFSYFSTTPSRKNYDIWNPPYSKIGSSDEYDLSDNLTAYYRASGIDPAAPLTSLENSVPGSNANSYLESVTSDPQAYVGSPIFPDIPVAGYDGVGNKINFNSAGAPPDVASTQYLRSVGDATALTMGVLSSDVAFTLSVVFRLDSLGTAQYLIEKSRTNATLANTNLEYSLSVNTNGTISFKKGRSSPNPYSYVDITSDLSYPVTAGSWHHVVATFTAPDADDISKFKIFINGIDRTSNLTSFGVVSDAAFNSSARLRVGVSIAGANVDPNSAIVNGEIHSVGIWKQRVLTASEISDLNHFELTGSAIGQVRHRIGPDGIEKASALRYGVSNINPEFATTAWNPTHFGYARDMIEPRRLTAAADGTAPIKIRFMSGSALILDAANTHAQNLDTAATSSLPFFDDGIARNRDDNPDETLLSV